MNEPTTQPDQDELLTLAEMARVLTDRASGRATYSRSRLHNWHRIGCKGIHLRTKAEPGKRLTCLRWVDEFLEAVTSQMSQPIHTPTKSELDTEDAASIEHLKSRGFWPKEGK